MDKAARHTKAIRNFANGAALRAQMANSGGIQRDARPSQCFTLGACVSQSCADTFHYQAAF